MKHNRIMVLLSIIFIFIFSTQIVGASKEIIVEYPFYLRARIHDSHTASVQFEIAEENNQRTCQMYKFTIRHNNEHPHSMPEQNLTFWRNSIELKHLAAGDYNVCAIICSEQLRSAKHHYEHYIKKNRTMPIIACVHFHAFRPHLLVLTLYVLVLIFLIISQIIYSLRKRQFKARIRMALIEIENSLQKWRSAQTSSTSTDHIQSYSILQSLINLPALPTEHLVSLQLPSNNDEPNPVIFHLDNPTEETAL